MKQVLSGALMLASMISIDAYADTISVDGAWHEFFFPEVDGQPWDRTFDFVLADSATLYVTDAWRSGDIFEVFINNSSVGETSYTSNTTQIIFGDYDAGLASPDFSSGSWVLGPGSYIVSGLVSVSYGSGRAAVMLDSTVPDVPLPATVWLFGSGILGLLGVARRKKSQLN